MNLFFLLLLSPLYWECSIKELRQLGDWNMVQDFLFWPGCNNQAGTKESGGKAWTLNCEKWICFEQPLRSEDSAITQCWNCRRGRRTEAKLRKSGGTLITLPLPLPLPLPLSSCCHHKTPVKWDFNSEAKFRQYFEESKQPLSWKLSPVSSMVPSPASLFILFTSLSLNW